MRDRDRDMGININGSGEKDAKGSFSSDLVVRLGREVAILIPFFMQVA